MSSSAVQGIVTGNNLDFRKLAALQAQAAMVNSEAMTKLASTVKHYETVTKSQEALYPDLMTKLADAGLIEETGKEPMLSQIQADPSLAIKLAFELVDRINASEMARKDLTEKIASLEVRDRQRNMLGLGHGEKPHSKTANDSAATSAAPRFIGNMENARADEAFVAASFG